MQCLPAPGVGSEAVAVLLAAAQDDPQEDVRKEAVRSPGMPEAHAQSAGPELVRLLADQEFAHLHDMAAWSLDRIKATMTRAPASSTEPGE